MTIRIGTLLGPYEILAPLGAGGMGEVWKARDTRLARAVAIKLLPAELSADVDRLKRFEKEARAASSLNHPNIVTVYDMGSSDSISWIAMELVDGKTLRELSVGGAMPTRKILAAAAQVAEGLAKAHGAGIVADRPDTRGTDPTVSLRRGDRSNAPMEADPKRGSRCVARGPAVSDEP